MVKTSFTTTEGKCFWSSEISTAKLSLHLVSLLFWKQHGLVQVSTHKWLEMVYCSLLWRPTYSLRSLLAYSLRSILAQERQTLNRKYKYAVERCFFFQFMIVQVVYPRDLFRLCLWRLKAFRYLKTRKDKVLQHDV